MPRPGRQNVVISGYYGFDNLGDDAILEELIDELSQLVPKENIVVLSNQPEKTAGLYAVKAINRWGAGDLYDALRNARLFVSGGGGLFQDVENLRSIIYYGGQLVLSKFLGTPSLIYAQGLGPLNSNLAKALTLAALKQTTTIAVRDDQSLALLESWQIKAQRTADPVWSLGKTVLKSSSAPSDAVLRLSSAGEARFLVGLSLRPSPNFSESHRQSLAKILKRTLPANALIVLIPMQEDQDLPVLKTMLAELTELGLEARLAPRENLKKPSDWLSLMAQLDLVVGMRLHALILALKEGKAVVGIEYDPKVENLIAQFEQPRLGLTQPFDEENREIWYKTVKNAVESRLEFAQKAQEHTKRLEKESCKNFDILAKILATKS
jgi:polysaccharide pyruvyl transferase CsaB